MIHLFALFLAAEGFIAAPPVVHTEARQPEPVVMEMEISAYVCEDEACVTYSGKHAEVGMVASTSLPMGQRLEIDGWPGVYVVADRGLLRADQLDIFMGSREAAIQWGRQKRLVRLVEE